MAFGVRPNLDVLQQGRCGLIGVSPAAAQLSQPQRAGRFVLPDGRTSRLVAIGGLSAIVLGAFCGFSLRLSNSLFDRPQASAAGLSTAQDPNYARYLAVMASIPAQKDRAKPAAQSAGALALSPGRGDRKVRPLAGSRRGGEGRGQDQAKADLDASGPSTNEPGYKLAPDDAADQVGRSTSPGLSWRDRSARYSYVSPSGPIVIYGSAHMSEEPAGWLTGGGR